MPFKPVAKYLFIAVLCIAVCGQAVIMALPRIAETLIRSRMPDMDQRFQPEFRIENIGWSTALLRDIRIGRDVSADLAVLTYGRKGQNGFRINTLTVSGLTLNAAVDEGGRIRLNGMELNSPDAPGTSPAAPFFPLPYDFSAFSAVIPEKVNLKNARLNIDYNGIAIQVPVRLTAEVAAEKGEVSARAQLHPFGQAVDFTLAGDTNTGMTRFRAAAPGFRPEIPGLLLAKQLNGLEFSGPMDIEVHKARSRPWEFTLSGLGLTAPGLPGAYIDNLKGTIDLAGNASGNDPGASLIANGKLIISDKRFSSITLGFSAKASLGPDTSPAFTLEAKAAPMETFTMAHGPEKRIQAALNQPALDMTVLGNRDGQECRIRVSGQSFVSKAPTGSINAGDLSLTTVIRGNLFNSGGSGRKIIDHVDIRSTFENLKVNTGKASIVLNTTLVSGAFHTDEKSAFPVPVRSGRAGISVRKLTAAMGTDTLSAPRLDLNAEISADPKTMSIDLDTAMSDILAIVGGNRFEAQNTSATGILSVDEHLNPRISLDTKVRDGTFALISQGISGSEISLDFPVSYPFTPPLQASRSGMLRVETLRISPGIHGRLACNLAQTGDLAVAAAGRLSGPSPEGPALDLELNAGFDREMQPNALLLVKSDPFLYTNDILAEMMPGTAFFADLPVKAALTLSSEARISLTNNRLDTQGMVRVHDGHLKFPGPDLSIGGIRGRVHFSDLLKPASRPGQELFAASVDAGQFKISDARLRFTLEDSTALNIENLRFKWCNGLVSTESIRLRVPDRHMTLTLYCDRLEMDSLLRQLGAFDANGGGTLNGRIPVVYDNGNISFNNGFLFSTPGSGGRVMIRDLDRMMAGIPKGTPEFSNLDMAGEALKDFEYKWAKLWMNTQGETLDVKMELDGKPARIMPFEYNKEVNAFVRVGASSPGSRFQGIKLDVNLKLPFNRVMKFGNTLKEYLD